MSLPKIDVPVYSAKLISTGKTVKYRPFTVKEEKLFLMANESEEIDTVIDTIKQVLNNCVVSKGFNIDDLPLFDIEYLFLKLRAASVGEVVNLKYKCNNILPKLDGEEEEKKCNHIVEIDLNINDIVPETVKKDTKIEITEKMGIVMKYPTFDLLKAFDTEDEVVAITNMTVACIDYIYDKENIYYAKDAKKEELIDFVDSMQSKDLEKIKQFFESMPKLKKQLDFKCVKCGYQEKIELEGIQNFFG
jgi:hypothetical protein